MSQSAETTSESDVSPTLGARENYFESDTDEYDSDDETLTGPRQMDVDRDWGIRHSFCSGVSKVEHAAHNILRENGSATFICPLCLWGDDELGIPEETTSELSDPDLYMPKEFPEQFAPDESGQYRFRRRYCDHPGAHISFGGKLGNRPTDQFMEKVDEVLDFVVVNDNTALARETADDIRSGALHMKMDGTKDDVDIMEEVVSDVLTQIGELE